MTNHITRRHIMNNILELHQVCKTFPKQKNMKSAFTLDHVSFSLPYGAILGFVGENGAGKSTTIKMLTGLLTPTSGKVIVNGIIPNEKRIENNKIIVNLR